MAQTDTHPVTPITGDGPAQLVAQGYAVLRIENETLAQVALQRPRDETKVLSGAVKELDLVPEEASKAYYVIPYRDTAPGGEQKMVEVTGPSIKAATALARRWGNCSATARILDEDADSVGLEGVFIDFETSVRFTRPIRVSKWMKTRRGVILLNPKRLEAAVAAGASKAMRNAILTGLPAYLVNAYDKRAREIAGGKAEVKLDAKTRTAIIKAFGKFQVTEDQLADYLDKKVEEWTGADRARLIGVYNALDDGQTTAQEVFGGGTSTEEQTGTDGATGDTTLTPDSLSGAIVTGEDNAGPTDKPKSAAPDPERAALVTRIAGKLNGLSTKKVNEHLAAVDLKTIDDFDTADLSALQDLATRLEV